MKKEKAEPAVLYRNEHEIRQLRLEIEGVFSLAKRIADEWNRMQLVPPMTKEIMKELREAGGVLFEDLLWRYIQQEAERVHGPRYAATLNRKAHDLTEYYDPVRMTGLLNALVTQSNRFHYVTTDVVSFDGDGMPYIDGATIERYEGRFTVYDTPDNRRKFEVYENAQKALTALQELMKEQNLSGDPIRWERGKGLTAYKPLFTYGKPANA